MKPSFWTPICILVYYIAWSHAVPLNSSVAESNSTVLSHSLNAWLPPSLDDLKLVPAWKKETQLNPLDVYLLTIGNMVLLGLQPNEGRVDIGKIAMLQSPDARVIITTLEKSPRLQPRYLIIALYNIVFAMYEKKPGFFKLSCNVFFKKELVGIIHLIDVPKSPVLSGSQNATTAEPVETERAVSLVSGVKPLTDDSGFIVDPDDVKFRILWDAGGRSVLVQDILSAAVDGISSTTQYDHNSFCTHFTGISFSTAVSFHMNEVSNQNVTCGRMARTYLLLVLRVVKKKRIFQEMEFSLEYDGVTIGTGFIFKNSAVKNNGTDAIAIL